MSQMKMLYGFAFQMKVANKPKDAYEKTSQKKNIYFLLISVF